MTKPLRIEVGTTSIEINGNIEELILLFVKVIFAEELQDIVLDARESLRREENRPTVFSVPDFYPFL